MTEKHDPVPITGELLSAIECRLVRELDDIELRYWPFLKDWLLKFEYRRARNVEASTSRGRRVWRLANVKIMAALFISLLAFGALKARLRRSPNRVVVFSASSRVEKVKNRQIDEFAKCAAALEGADVPTLYHTVPDQILDAPLAWLCHENLLIHTHAAVLKLFSIAGCFRQTRKKVPHPAAVLISSEVGLDVSEIDAAIMKFDVRVRAYRWLMMQLSLRHIYVVSAYTKTDLVHAARGLGIHVTELQHGILAPFHPSYTYKSLDRGWVAALPHSLVVKNDFWSKTQRVFEYAEVLVAPLSTSTSSQTMPKLQRPFLLFTGQGVAYESISRLVCEFRASADHARLDFIYSCHPTEKPSEVRVRLGLNEDPRVSVEPFISSAHTKEMIVMAEKHLSVYSSCHVDALEHCGETFVFRVPGFATQVGLFNGIDGVHFFTSIKELKVA